MLCFVVEAFYLFIYISFYFSLLFLFSKGRERIFSCCESVFFLFLSFLLSFFFSEGREGALSSVVVGVGTFGRGVKEIKPDTHARARARVMSSNSQPMSFRGRPPSGHSPISWAFGARCNMNAYFFFFFFFWR